MLRRFSCLFNMIVLGVSLRIVGAFQRQSVSQHLSRRPTWRGLSKRHGRTRGKNKETPKIEGPFNYHDEVDLLIEDLSNLGDGVAKVDLPASLLVQAEDSETLPASKYVVMVPHVMVGERVRARVWSNRGSHSLADLVEILEPSPLRVKPPCPLFGSCGGCQYQFMPIEEQRRLKRGHVEGVLQRIGGVEAPVVLDAVGTAEEYGYRTKLTPHHDKPDKLTGEVGNIGFKKLGGRGMNLVDVEQCIIATPKINERLVTLRGEVKSRAYHRAKTDQEREANPELTDFEKQNARRKLKGATLLLRHASALGGEETSSSEKDGDESTRSDGNGEGDESVVVTDPNAEVMEKVAGKQFALKLQFRAGEFFQNNPFVLPLLVDHVLSEARAPLRQRGGSGGTADPGTVATHLIDAYCGGGLFCLAAAAHFDRCAGIEISALNIASAKRNAQRNGITNCEFMAGTAEDIFQNVNFDPTKTVLIIDPPRAGCTEEFLDQLLAFQPARVVYVSCDPATQARDARILIDGGYSLGAATPFDLFPQTRHIESAITFNLIPRELQD